MIENFEQLDACMRDHAGADVRKAWNKYRQPRYRMIGPMPGYRAAMVWYHERSQTLLTPGEELLNALLGDYTIIAIDTAGRILSESGHINGRSGGVRKREVWNLSRRFGNGGRAGFHHLLSPHDAFFQFDRVHAEAGVRALQLAATHAGDDGVTDDRLIKMLMRRERLQARTACDALGRFLNRDLIGSVRRLRLPRNDNVYSWLAHPDPSLRKRRLQAAAAFPFFTEYFVSGMPDGREKQAELVEAIDGGKPLLPLLATAFGVKQATIRRLRLLGARELAYVKAASFNKLIQLMDGVPYEYWPQQAREWRYVAAMVADHPLRALFPEQMIDPFMQRALVRAARRGWREGARRYFAAFRHVQGLRDLRDLSQAIWDLVGMDEVENEDAMMREIGSLLEPYGLARALRWNETWHIHQWKLPYPAALMAPGELWPPVSEPFRFRGRNVVPLASPRGLFEEGRQMQHCVGSYVKRCISGRAHIVSCRDRAGVSQSTAELRLEHLPGLIRVAVVQHRGPANRPPSRQCRNALTAYIEYLNGMGSDYFERLLRKQRQRCTDSHVNRYEYLLESRGIQVLKATIPPALFADLARLKKMRIPLQADGA